MNFREVFDEIFILEMAIATAVFVVVTAVVGFVVVHYRRRAGREPSQRSEHNALEIGYGIGLFAIAVFLVVVTAAANGRQQQVSGPQRASGLQQVSGPPQLRLMVTSYQWNWQFHYPDQNVTVSGVKNGQEPLLVLPTNQVIDVEVTSRDVIHSFWVPELRYKMDAFPHQVNRFKLKLTRTGEWTGWCAEYCGPYHYAMKFRLRAVSPEQFTAWTQSGGVAT
jgi:cytochrome c oxidase subunit II